MIGDNFRIRCSAIASIMAASKTGSLTAAQQRTVADYQSRDSLTANQSKELARLIAKRDAAPELPAGAKTLCDNWLQDAMYRRRSSFGSKQTEKGTRTEDDGIELLREYLQDPFVPAKNEWRVIGEYIEGECDLHYLPIVYDIKSCYTHSAMDLHAVEAVKVHHDQLQGYGHLFGAARLGLTRVLCDMPEDMIQREAYFATKAEHGPDHTEEQYATKLESLTRRYTYGDLPIAMRVHTVTFDFSPAFIKQVIERVKMCRKHINERFAALPAHKREAVEAYVAERERKAHYADVKRTEQRAKEWRAEHWGIIENQPETAQTLEV